MEETKFDILDDEGIVISPGSLIGTGFYRVGGVNSVNYGKNVDDEGNIGRIEDSAESWINDEFRKRRFM